MTRVSRQLIWLTIALSLSACASPTDGLGYYWQSISGHMSLMNAARPIDDALRSQSIETTVKDKLRYARRARAFASSDLSLPDNGSYTRFADLGRPYVLWNVFAAPELSLKLKKWCVPVAGCIAYRGLYDKQVAEQYAKELADQGMDVQVGGVPAYSTLGWFDDPIPSTIIRYSPPGIARLIFHELAHQVVYVKGDSTFNESFATAVEQIGLDRWMTKLEAQGDDPAVRQQYLQAVARKRDFLALLRQTRNRLESIYKSDRADMAKRQLKVETFKQLRTDYEQLKQEKWNGFAGYDRWFNRPLGNAHLAAIGAYHDLVPAFRKILDQNDGDLARFYEAVRELGALAPEQRRDRLNALKSDTSS